jgi:predicted MFS family arabinose efflux permease
MFSVQAGHEQLREHSVYSGAIAGLVGLALAMGVGRFAFTPLLPLMVAEGDISLSDGAWLAAANYFGYLIGALAGLRVKGDPATFIRAALLATAAVTFGMGFTHDFTSWIALRWAAGFASAFLLVFISAWSLERVSALQRPFVSAVPFSGVGAGIFAVGVFCVALDRSSVSAAEIWIALGVLSVLLTAAVWPVFVTTEVRSRRASATPQDHATNRRTSWKFVLCYAFFGFGYIVPATFLPAMARNMAAGGWAFDISWPAFGLAACVSTFAAAYASARRSTLTVWRNAQIAMAVGVVVPVFSATSAALVIAALCVGGTFMVITMLGLQTAKQFAGPDARRLMAAMTAGFAAGQLAGPLTVPYLVGPGGDFSAVLILASAMLIAGVCLLPLRSRALQHERSAAKENAP